MLSCVYDLTESTYVFIPSPPPPLPPPRVAANSSSNKMNLNNLATLFGPNLLRPAPMGQEESLLSMAAMDVATPVNVLMYFLSCPEEYLDETQVQTSPVSTASTGRGRRRDSRRKLTWIEEEDGARSSVRSSRRNSGRNSQTWEKLAIECLIVCILILLQAACTSSCCLLKMIFTKRVTMHGIECYCIIVFFFFLESPLVSNHQPLLMTLLSVLSNIVHISTTHWYPNLVIIVCVCVCACVCVCVLSKFHVCMYTIIMAAQYNGFWFVLWLLL